MLVAFFLLECFKCLLRGWCLWKPTPHLRRQIIDVAAKIVRHAVQRHLNEATMARVQFAKLLGPAATCHHSLFGPDGRIEFGEFDIVMVRRATSMDLSVLMPGSLDGRAQILPNHSVFLLKLITVWPSQGLHQEIPLVHLTFIETR